MYSGGFAAYPGGGVTRDFNAGPGIYDRGFESLEDYTPSMPELPPPPLNPYETIRENYQSGSEERFRRYIKTCQRFHRGWAFRNVFARSLHVAHAMVTVFSGSLNTAAGLLGGVVSILLAGRVKELNVYADSSLESTASIITHLYNDVLGIVNPSAAHSEEEILASYGASYIDGKYEKIGPESLADKIRISYGEAINHAEGRGVGANLLLRVKTVGYIAGSVIFRTTELAVSILFIPLDIVALGSHKSLHNLVVRGLRAPAIIGDLVTYTRVILSIG